MLNHTTVYGCRHSKIRQPQQTSAAIINIAESQVVTLPAEKVASGFMYSNGRYTLRGKGNEATWTIGIMASEHCVAD